MEQKKIRVIVADDHPGVRSFVCRTLNQERGIEVVGVAQNGLEALHLVEQLHPDVLVLDVEMPVMDGIQVVQELRRVKSSVHVLAFSVHSNAEFIQSTLDFGADGYLVKEDAPQHLVCAVHSVAHGKAGWIH